ncbi:MAG: hypothetical protein BWY11_00990 [Firmicutes bacterium ADurb.Bin182]|nr:MAG: hypothetical protein BWY11_00990 [Firmicutes bacterium ADurb.Bin182]
MEDTVTRSAKITDLNIDSHMSYDNTALLTLHISAPQISIANPAAQKAINEYYKIEAEKFNSRAAGYLFDRAMEEYNISVANGFPLRAFEAFMNYSVRLNSNCTLSTYFDQYEYAGGAHGSTLRTSVTFDLNNGKRIKLKDLFGAAGNYRRLILDEILIIADKQMATNPVYFNDYRRLIVQNFNGESFYLTPDGIVIYYQQYEIGPYAIGIVEFEIPYQNLGIRPPSCG